MLLSAAGGSGSGGEGGRDKRSVGQLTWPGSRCVQCPRWRVLPSALLPRA